MSLQDEPCKRCKLDNKTECSNGTEVLLEHLELVDDGKSNDELEMQTWDEVAVRPKENGIEMPTLVLETFLEWLEDVELLKTCRLVNKYWNSLACASLRIHAVVKPESYQFRAFRKCLEPGQFGEVVPSPFKNIHADISSGLNYVAELATFPNLITSGVDLYGSFEPDEIPIINQFLKSVVKDVTSLRIPIWNDSYDQVLKDVKFQSLKSLIISYNHHYCVHKRTETLKLTLESSVLERLKIHCCCSLTCTLPLLTLNLSRLVELKLNEVPPETFQADNFHTYLENLQIPSLKTLKFERIRIDLSQRKNFNTFLNNFAANLTELHLDYIWYGVRTDWRFDFTGMVFPKLKILSINHPEDVFVVVTPEIFPSLKEVYLKGIRDEKLMFKSSGQNSLQGVRLLHISFDVSQKRIFNAILANWMLNLDSIFPHVQNFGISGKHPPAGLCHIHRAYPNLKCLRVESPSGYFNSFFETCGNAVHMQLCAGRCVPPIPQTRSLFSFKELESLALLEYDEATLNHYTFEHGVSRLTNVKDLECSWHDSLSAEVVARSLQHVKKLKIVQGRIEDSEMKYQLTELKKALPGCEVIYKKRRS